VAKINLGGSDVARRHHPSQGSLKDRWKKSLLSWGLELMDDLIGPEEVEPGWDGHLLTRTTRWTEA